MTRDLPVRGFVDVTWSIVGVRVEWTEVGGGGGEGAGGASPSSFPVVVVVVVVDDSFLIIDDSCLVCRAPRVVKYSILLILFI